MENNNVHEYFNDSFKRCQNNPDFLDRFYNVFIGKSPEIGNKFQGVSIAQQKKILGNVLFYMVIANHSKETLIEIAKKHSTQGLDIAPHFYPLWLDSLIEAAKISDPKFDDNTEIAWRTIMQPGIDYMISHYR